MEMDPNLRDPRKPAPRPPFPTGAVDLLADRLHSVSYLVRPPRTMARDLLQPVLCFLHGLDEGPPTPIRWAATRHGPLHPGAADRARDFLVVVPQLPHRGDLWNRHAATVAEIVLDARARFGGDPQRTYLTGLGHGGSGVFDLARAQPRMWAALWAADPVRMPRRRPRQPVWLSEGGARAYGDARAYEWLLAHRCDAPDFAAVEVNKRAQRKSL